MFVDYTWQCMKLPDQPSTTTSTALGTGLSGKTNTEESFFGGAVSDVTVAAADSTTLGVLVFCVCNTVQCKCAVRCSLR